MSVIIDTPTQDLLDLNINRHHSNCLLCGKQNPFGFKLNFILQEDDSVKADYLCEHHLQGYSNILHGGIISSLLDCSMVHCLFAHDIIAVTAEMNIRFKDSVQIDAPLCINAKIRSSQGNLFIIYSSIVQKEIVKAKAIGKFMKSMQVL